MKERFWWSLRFDERWDPGAQWYSDAVEESHLGPGSRQDQNVDATDYRIRARTWGGAQREYPENCEWR